MHYPDFTDLLTSFLAVIVKLAYEDRDITGIVGGEGLPWGDVVGNDALYVCCGCRGLQLGCSRTACCSCERVAALSREGDVLIAITYRDAGEPSREDCGTCRCRYALKRCRAGCILTNFILSHYRSDQHAL